MITQTFGNKVVFYNLFSEPSEFLKIYVLIRLERLFSTLKKEQ